MVISIKGKKRKKQQMIFIMFVVQCISSLISPEGHVTYNDAPQKFPRLLVKHVAT